MMSAHARLKGDIQSVVRDAHALGVGYVVCSTIPHRKHITAQDCDQAIEDFNRWGKVLADSKLRLCYHTHGVEFGPSPDGTLFDTLVKRTDPRFANYEMDIFWIVYAYQDPVKLLHKYPGRFPLMHVKDIRKDTPLGGSPGDVHRWKRARPRCTASLRVTSPSTGTVSCGRATARGCRGED